MSGPGPRAVVNASVVPPPRVGLIASARIIDEPDDRWENGFTYAPENCASAGITDPCGDELKQIGVNQAIVTEDPYYVWAGDRCSSFGFEARDYKGRANRLLLACESKQMEHEFWTGVKTTAQGWPNRFLASNTLAEVVTTAPAEAIQALACLEQYLADCGCGTQGMIHAPRHIVTLWDNGHVLRREGNRILTIHDTIVVPGAGYTGSGPGNVRATTGHVWAYATGIVDVRQSPIQVVPDDWAQAIDKKNNTIEFRAERISAASWDGCCHGAAEIDAPICAGVAS